jgi:chitin synthase
LSAQKDESDLEAFQNRWGNHSSFKAVAVDHTGFPMFTINHFNGLVTYRRFPPAQFGRSQSRLHLRVLRIGHRAQAPLTHLSKDFFQPQQVIKPMQTPSTRKGGVKRMPTVKEERDREDNGGGVSTSASHGRTPCVAREFRAALDTLFETLDETQP